MPPPGSGDPSLVEATSDNLAAVLDAEVPVVVDLWAPWVRSLPSGRATLGQMAWDRAGRLNVVNIKRR